MNTGQDRRAKIRVLVVDDGQLNRRLSERLLTHLNCDVLTAEDAAEGIETLREKRVDIVFSDVEMPDMNGVEAVNHFRAAAGGRLTVVAVSGQSLGDDVKAYQDAGFDDYVPKPLTIDALRDCLARWCPTGDANP